MAGPTIGVLTPWSGGFFYGQIIAGVTAEVAAAGGKVVVIQSVEPSREPDDVLPVPDISAPSAWNEIDGAISVTSAGEAHLRALRERGVPVVLACDVVDGLEIPSAVGDNVGGTRDAVEHLIAHGHTRIGFVGNLLRSDTRARYASYQQTLRAHDLEPDPALSFAAPNDVAWGGRVAAERILAERPDMTAVFVATDYNAIGLLERLAEARVAVPGDLAVVGFDDADRSSFTRPALTTVRQPFTLIGSLAARLVLAMLDGQDVAPGPHMVASSLAVRHSCGCTSAPDDLGLGAGGTSEELDRTFVAEVASILLPATVTEASLGDLRDASRHLVAEIRAALAAGGPAPGPSLDDAVAAMVPGGTTSEALRRLLATVTLFVSRAATGSGSDPAPADRVSHVTARVAAGMWHEHTRLYLERDLAHQRARAEQYRIGADLIDLRNDDPLTLSWLGATHVDVGCLALWTDPTHRRVHVESVHDVRDVLGDVVGTDCAVEDFPPRALIQAARPGQDEVVFVVPVQTHGNSRGLLAVVGPLDMVAMSAHEAYAYWASQLTVALEQRDLLESVRRSEERLALAIEATAESLWDWDLTTDTMFYSPRARSMLGIDDPDERRPDAWWAAVHPEDLLPLKMMLAGGQGEGREIIEQEHRLRTPDGSYRWTLCRARPAGPAGVAATRIVGSLADIHPRKELEEQLRDSATHDTVTGLPNRRLFLDRLRVAVAQSRRSGTPFAVLFLDLDGFKVVNDSLGHEIGDRLLVEVGCRLESQLRDVDTAARFGGDEFAVLLNDIDPADILPAANRLLEALHAPARIDGHELTLGASMGIATSAVTYKSPEDVLRDADTAMYAAKSTDRGSLEFFDVAMHARAKSRLAMHQELRSALENGEFVVHYQPIVDLPSGDVTGFEALVRWQHPERGVVLPVEFLPVMEETGLIVRLGHWTIRQVCHQVAEWRDTGAREVPVSINVSDREFWHAGLLPHIRAMLAEFGVPADLLTLEITETVIMHRPELAERLLGDMRRAGLRLHVDAFGTGHSSLQTLHRYPVEALKIDRSFVGALTTSAQGREIVDVIVALGRALGLDVVAEGVETLEQVAILRALGCSSVQGTYLSEAVTGPEAGRFLEQRLLAAEEA